MTANVQWNDFLFAFDRNVSPTLASQLASDISNLVFGRRLGLKTVLTQSTSIHEVDQMKLSANLM
jgi:hypothetical protein